MIDFYAIDIMEPATSLKISEVIKWCKENDIEFYTRAKFGARFGDNIYSEEEMREAPITIPGLGELDAREMTVKNIGTIFLLPKKEDMVAFKLTWIL